MPDPSDYLPEDQTPEPDPRKNGKTADGERRGSQTDELVVLALERYRLGLSDQHEAFALPIPEDGCPAPNVGILMRTDQFKRSLASMFYRTNAKAPSGSCVNDAINVLGGMAEQMPPRALHLRMAEHDGGIVVDLGDTSGKCVIVSADEWRVQDRAPVPFRRTAPTAAMPAPTDADGCELIEWIGRTFNVEPTERALLAAWIVAAFIPSVEHPILYLAGEQGSAKTTATARLGALIDPGPAPTQRQPANEDEWSTLAAQTYVIPLDNISNLAFWFSDALCRAVTGDATYRRKLYTTDDLAVMRSRNCVIINGIELTPIRGDLASRTIKIELHTLEGKHKRKRDLDREFEDSRPHIFAAIMDALVLVLRELPNIEDDERTHRLEDFRRVVCAFDRVYGTDTLSMFWDKADELNESVVESSSLVGMLLDLVEDQHGRWSGSASELHAVLSAKDRLPRDFPKTPNALGSQLKRLAPSLRQVGLRAEAGHTGSGKSKKRCWTLTATAGEIRPDEPTTQRPPEPRQASLSEARDEGGTPTA